MIARRNSACPACRGPIAPGDTITKRGRFYVCAACAGDAAPTWQQRGPCEDAPCCGCGGVCGTPPGYGGYATVITAY